MYLFGQTISIPYFDKSHANISYYDKILENQSIGIHTLCLLDIKVKEPTFETMTMEKKEFLPPRYMSVAEGIAQLLEIGEREDRQGRVISPDTICIGLARVGKADQKIFAAPMHELANTDFGAPLHSLVVPGDMREYEWEAILPHMTAEARESYLLRKAEIEANKEEKFLIPGGES